MSAKFRLTVPPEKVEGEELSFEHTVTMNNGATVDIHVTIPAACQAGDELSSTYYANKVGNGGYHLPFKLHVGSEPEAGLPDVSDIIPSESPLSQQSTGTPAQEKGEDESFAFELVAAAISSALSLVAEPVLAVAEAMCSRSKTALRDLAAHDPPRVEEFGGAVDMLALAKLCEATLSNEQRCLQVRAPCTVIGDLHGCWGDTLTALSYAVEQNQPDACRRLQIIFIGDYVDRGDEQIQVLWLVMALKELSAFGELDADIYLLRGNHELQDLEPKRTKEGLFRQGSRRLPYVLADSFGMDDGKRLWEQLYGGESVFPMRSVHGERRLLPTRSCPSTFAELSLCAFITTSSSALGGDASSSRRIVCMHAGIGKTVEELPAQVDAIRRDWKIARRRDIESMASEWRFAPPAWSGVLDELEKLGETQEAAAAIGKQTMALVNDLLWSDPIERPTAGHTPIHGVKDVYESARGEGGQHAVAYCFGPSRLQSFMSKHGLVAMIRGHQNPSNGYRCQHVGESGGGVVVTVHTGRYDKDLEQGAVLWVEPDLGIVARHWKSTEEEAGSARLLPPPTEEEAQPLSPDARKMLPAQPASDGTQFNQPRTRNVRSELAMHSDPA
jgi:diadenosine tetraphosphatase ApaH/serine/threonine PP2A family protein phosphatase